MATFSEGTRTRSRTQSFAARLLGPLTPKKTADTSVTIDDFKIDTPTQQPHDISFSSPSRMDSGRIANIEQMLKQLMPTVSMVQKIQDNLEEIKENQQAKFRLIIDTVDDMENELRAVKDENSVLNDRLNKLEAYSRRNNLLLFNVPEDEAPQINKVKRILSGQMSIDNVDNIFFENVHRLGMKKESRIRPIIFKLQHYADRQRIWVARNKLKGSKYILSEDLPQEYQKKRNLLKPVLSTAKALGKQATFVADKVKVDGKIYGVDDIKDLPPNLNPQATCTKQYDNMVCFFGRYSPLSNFYNSNFNVDGQHYNCIEQYLQSKRAELMGADQIATKILTLQDPADQQHEGRKSRGDDKQWNAQASMLILKALTAKFQQNPDLATYLQATGTQTLAEGSKNTTWGTGYSLNDPNNKDSNTWLGKNLLGNLLMRVRNDMIV